MTKERAPDGGWGWVVVIGAFAIHAISDGINYTTAIFYKEWLHHFNSTASETALAISLMSGSSLFVAAFIAVYGCRSVALFGSVVSTIGLILSALAPSIKFLIFSFGILAGCGFGFLYIPSVIVITEYFDSKMAFAAGLAACGSGVGIVVFAPLIEVLISHFKWRTTMFILAGITVFNFFLAITFIPLHSAVQNVDDISLRLGKLGSPMKEEPNEKVIEALKNSNDSDSHSTQRSSSSSPTFVHENSRSPLKQTKQTKLETLKESVVSMLGTKLLLNPIFIIYVISTFQVNIGFMVPQIYLKVRALQLDEVHSEKDTHGLLSLIGVGSTFGRAFFGFIADYEWCHRFVVFVVTTVLCGLSAMLSVFCNTYLHFAGFCLIFGLTSGAFIGLISIILTDCFGIANVANACGLLALFEGIAMFIGPPLIGLFESKTYKTEYLVAGGFMVIGGLTFVLIPIYKYFKNIRTDHLKK